MTKTDKPTKTLDLGEPWSTDPECGHESIIDRHGNLVADCAAFNIHAPRTDELNRTTAARIVELVNAAAAARAA